MMDYDSLKDELLSAVDTGLKFARTVDKEAEFELYLSYQNMANVNIKQGVVEATDGVIEGIAVRVAKQNRVSFASSSGISTQNVKRSITEAMTGLKSVSIEDARFKGFCEPKKPGSEGAFASEILNLDREQLIANARFLVKEGREFDKRVLVAGSSCSVEWGGFAVGNTRGVQQASRSASNKCQVYCVAADKDERRSAYEYDITRERLIRPEGLGEKAARKAVRLIGAKKLDKTAILPTIWEPIAASAYILASLGQSANGRPVVEGMSPIADKIGKEIASQSLTVLDDGQNPASIMTEAIDAEGHPQQRNTVVEKGILKKFLFDTYYARVRGTESTGNCARGGGLFGYSLPYEVSPTISPKFFEVLPGKKGPDDLISSIDDQAVLIVDVPIGIFHSSVSTGEFSAVAQSVFLVQNGEKKNPLQPVSVSGNFYKGFKQIYEIGNDLKTTPFSVETPSLTFDGFSVVR
jgi:PmbA protein